MSEKYIHVTHEPSKYSQWYPVRTRNYRLCCCDCGLVHDIEFRPFLKSRLIDQRKTKLEIRLRRNNRATAQIRRHLKTS